MLRDGTREEMTAEGGKKTRGKYAEEKEEENYSNVKRGEKREYEKRLKMRNLK